VAREFSRAPLGLEPAGDGLVSFRDDGLQVSMSEAAILKKLRLTYAQQKASAIASSDGGVRSPTSVWALKRVCRPNCHCNSNSWFSGNFSGASGRQKAPTILVSISLSRRFWP